MKKLKLIKLYANYKKYWFSSEEISKLGVDFLAFDINVLDSGIVRNLKKHKFHILTWTVDTPEKYKKSQKLADNCIFEKIKIN